MAETRQESGTAPARGRRQRKVGVIVSNKMQKTVVVAVERLVAHAMYGKRVRRTSKFLAHDETNQCRMGDEVAIVECRPYSARKRWRVASIVKRATEPSTTVAGDSEGA